MRLLPPSLCQCSVSRMFKVIATRIKGKSKQTLKSARIELGTPCSKSRALANWVTPANVGFWGEGKTGVSGEKLFAAGARFSKVPQLYGPFSGVTSPAVCQERRGYELSRQTSHSFRLLFPQKRLKRSAFLDKRLAGSQMAFWARRVCRDFQETGPRVENQKKTQPTYGVESGNRSWGTLVEGECSPPTEPALLPTIT